MHLVRSFLVALCFVVTSASSQGVAPDAALVKAMRCIHGAMTDSLLPVGVMHEQLASAALARCSDEIESAATAVASAGGKPGAIEIARAAVRRELYGYALQSAGGSYVLRASASDASDDATTDPRAATY